MMGRKHPFCIGQDSDEERLQEALVGLRRMIRYGRLAEKALRNLRTQGFCDCQVPVATRIREGYPGHIQAVRFPAFVNVTRADVPDYGQFKFQFGKAVKGEHGGQMTDEVQVRLHATGWCQHFEEWKPRSLHVGNARLKRNGETVFVSNRSEGIDKEGVSKLYKAGDSTNAKLAYLTIARTFAHHMVRMYKEQDVSQPFTDLREKLADWLVEDGHVRDFCIFLRENAVVASVLEA